MHARAAAHREEKLAQVRKVLKLHPVQQPVTRKEEKDVPQFYLKKRGD